MSHIFAIYKPKGPTSHDIIDQLRKITGIKKIGHAGTLDPLATGILVVAIGREATRQLDTLVKKEKEYLAEIKLGVTSSTDDAEGDKEVAVVKKIPQLREINEVIKKLEGKIKQTPPIFSAIKVKGQKAYRLARQGKPLQLKPRLVEIKEIEILKYSWPDLSLRLVTGPGFYVRALARDIGKKLKTGGYLYALERTRVGEFTKSQAKEVADFKKIKL